MTFEEHMQKWLNRPVDTDGVYPNQCMDLMHAYIQDVLGLDRAILAAPSAYLVYENFDNLKGHGNFEKIAKDPYTTPQKGDLVVFDQSIGINGHICEFIEGDQNTFKSFDANWPVGFLPHVQTHDYNGVSGWLRPKQTMPAQTYKYKIGDTLEPSVDIPVGAKRGEESMVYGHIGFKFPAKVIGMYNGYYNIDQSAIGGGSGWVKADIVDATPAFIPHEDKPVTPAPSGVSYTEEQYKSMQKERDEALAKFTEVNDKLVVADQVLTGFRALGITSTEDITNLKATYAKDIEGLNTQLIDVLKRSTKLTEIIKDKDTEDYTAIELGMTAQKKVQELEGHMKQIAQNVGTKPNIGEILKKIWFIGNLAERALKKAEKEVKTEVPVPEPQTKGYSLDWLLSIFQLKGGEQK